MRTTLEYLDKFYSMCSWHEKKREKGKLFLVLRAGWPKLLLEAHKHKKTSRSSERRGNNLFTANLPAIYQPEKSRISVLNRGQHTVLTVTEQFTAFIQ